ncbi:MAG: hypothetical protein IKD27_04320 [Oscillospiraceae bacterium]|nr:hypothetical protein [Oscillospiraceae bacterium]
MSSTMISPEMIVQEQINRTSNAYDVIYLYGNTNAAAALAAAAEKAMRAKDPDSVIVHTSGDQFLEDLHLNCCQGTLRRMQNAYLGDYLILEDIQCVAGKEYTQQILYGIINSFLENGKQILITGTAPPYCIAALAPRIQAQLIGGINIFVE